MGRGAGGFVKSESLPHLVIARRAAPWQSTQHLNHPKRHGSLQGHVDCHGPAALAMTKWGGHREAQLSPRHCEARSAVAIQFVLSGAQRR
jgi:hypothetical protein